MSEAMSGTRSQRLADEVGRANAEVIRFVETCDPTAWVSGTTEEGWSISMGAAHIGVSHLILARWLHRLAAGMDVTEGLEDFAEFNADDQRYNSDLAPTEVVERLRTYGAALERFVRDLPDERLDRSASFLGGRMTCQELIEAGAIGHPRTHLANLIAATS